MNDVAQFREAILAAAGDSAQRHATEAAWSLLAGDAGNDHAAAVDEVCHALFASQQEAAELRRRIAELTADARDALGLEARA